MTCIKIVNIDSREYDDDNFAALDVIDYTFNCAWTRIPPTLMTYGVYAFIVPTLACFGLCANFINAIVFTRPKMTPSAFSYLAALAWMDCISCLLITFTALSRSIFFGNNFWLSYDFQWQTAMFGITTGAANLILACVSLDRLIYLWVGTPNGAPKFCRRKVARPMICAVVVLSALLNLPYFFIFVVNEDGTFQTTPFFHSKYYRFHNWLTFSLLALVPAIFLLLGNAAIIIAFHRWAKQRKICGKTKSKCSKTAANSQKERKRYLHQTKLTITIIIVITLYMFGELPAHLTSRKSALNLLFGGDISKVNFNIMQKYELIFMTLNVLQLSLNIVVYALINPCFMPEFFACLRSASDACFRCLCITPILNSCQRRRAGQKTKIDTKMHEVRDGTSEKSCDGQLEHSLRQRRYAINSWGDEISRSDVDMCCNNGVQLRKTSIFIISDSIYNRSEFVDSSWYHSLKADWVWKRSSSLTDFSCFNYAMSKECLANVITMESPKQDTTIKKRHSLTF